LVCNNSNNRHDINCPNYRDNALKSASNVNQQKQLIFNQSEIKLINNALKISDFFIKNNSHLYQNQQDILKEISIASNILSARKNNSVKGASQICDKTQSLINIKNMFGLN
jgi:hypothetical protein